jgi:hypothetical protein
LRVGVDQTLPDQIGAGVARARFAWTTGRVELCPTSGKLGSLELAPCGVMNAGAIWATDSKGLNPEDDIRFWWTTGALGRVRATFARSWNVELGAAVSATLLRDHFILRPATPIYKPAPVSVELGLAVGSRLP